MPVTTRSRAGPSKSMTPKPATVTDPGSQDQTPIGQTKPTLGLFGSATSCLGKISPMSSPVASSTPSSLGKRPVANMTGPEEIGNERKKAKLQPILKRSLPVDVEESPSKKARKIKWCEDVQVHSFDNTKIPSDCSRSEFDKEPLNMEPKPLSIRRGTPVKRVIVPDAAAPSSPSSHSPSPAAAATGPGPSTPVITPTPTKTGFFDASKDSPVVESPAAQAAARRGVVSSSPLASKKPAAFPASFVETLRRSNDRLREELEMERKKSTETQVATEEPEREQLNEDEKRKAILQHLVGSRAKKNKALPGNFNLVRVRRPGSSADVVELPDIRPAVFVSEPERGGSDKPIDIDMVQARHISSVDPSTVKATKVLVEHADKYGEDAVPMVSQLSSWLEDNTVEFVTARRRARQHQEITRRVRGILTPPPARRIFQTRHNIRGNFQRVSGSTRYSKYFQYTVEGICLATRWARQRLSDLLRPGDNIDRPIDIMPRPTRADEEPRLGDGQNPEMVNVGNGPAMHDDEDQGPRPLMVGIAATTRRRDPARPWADKWATHAAAPKISNGHKTYQLRLELMQRNLGKSGAPATDRTIPVLDERIFRNDGSLREPYQHLTSVIPLPKDWVNYAISNGVTEVPGRPGSLLLDPYVCGPDFDYKVLLKSIRNGGFALQYGKGDYAEIDDDDDDEVESTAAENLDEEQQNSPGHVGNMPGSAEEQHESSMEPTSPMQVDEPSPQLPISEPATPKHLASPEEGANETTGNYQSPDPRLIERPKSRLGTYGQPNPFASSPLNSGTPNRSFKRDVNSPGTYGLPDAFYDHDSDEEEEEDN